MRGGVFGCMIALAMPAAAVAEQTAISVERLGPDELRATVTIRGTTDPAIGQGVIATAVEELCGGRPGSLGHFTFTATEAVDKPEEPVMTLVQDVLCGASPVQQEARAATTWRAGPLDEARVEAAMLRFWERSTRGGAEIAYRMLSPGMQATSPEQVWIDEAMRDAVSDGAATSPPKLRFTWYYDPPTADPGAYVAVDFSRVTAALAVHCGYVAFRREETGEYRVVRVEQGRLRKDDARTMRADVREASIAALKCRMI